MERYSRRIDSTTQFFYNADFSGDVVIKQPGDVVLNVPAKDLIDFVVNHTKLVENSVVPTIFAGLVVFNSNGTCIFRMTRFVDRNFSITRESQPDVTVVCTLDEIVSFVTYCHIQTKIVEAIGSMNQVQTLQKLKKLYKELA